MSSQDIAVSSHDQVNTQEAVRFRRVPVPHSQTERPGVKSCLALLTRLGVGFGMGVAAALAFT